MAGAWRRSRRAKLPSPGRLLLLEVRPVLRPPKEATAYMWVPERVLDTTWVLSASWSDFLCVWMEEQGCAQQAGTGGKQRVQWQAETGTAGPGR